MRSIRLGIVGCGKVVENFHLPAVKGIPLFNLSYLVDVNVERAKFLAGKYSTDYFQDYRAIENKIDAVIIAVPNKYHCIISSYFLERGIHVFVEKPMALTTHECDLMINKARSSGCILYVGLVRRFFDASRFIKQVLHRGWLGKIQSFDFREGQIFSWRTVSGFYFNKDLAGGGTLMDIGSHALDLLIGWFGDPIVQEYFDDSIGGIEANALIKAKFGDSIEGTIELSRIRNLRDSCRIIGDKAVLEVGVRERSYVDFKWLDSTFSRKNTYKLLLDSSGGRGTYQHYIKMELADFRNLIRDGRQHVATAEEAKKSIQMIEECYRRRKLLSLPWFNPFSKTR